VRLQVYEMAIDTILLSFCEDCEANDGEPLYAPKLLMSAIGKGKKFEAQQQAGSSVADGGQMIRK
jgi:choline transporter-like protein 2/4/5